MDRHSPEFRRRTRASTASTTAGARTVSPEAYARRTPRRRRGPALSEAIDLTLTQPTPNPRAARPAKRARITTSHVSHESILATPLVPDPVDEKIQPWFLNDSIEEIDLTEADADDKLLAQAQEDALKLQKADGQEKPKLAEFKCVICLDDPTDLASTPCGKQKSQR